jgi:deazaflavin-dependent oxidoreductase (nitroreductase family)
MLLVWRLGLGGWVNAWPEWGGRIMVLTHLGRRSGLRRRTPVNYALLDGEVYCVAGFGSASDWYRNLRAHPQVEVWLPEGWWAGRAEDVSADPQRLKILRQVLIASGFAARLAGIDAHTLPDAELDALTAKYRLIRVQRAEARTGPGGPGDLAWVWPLAVMLLVPLLLLRPRAPRRGRK